MMPLEWASVHGLVEVGVQVAGGLEAAARVSGDDGKAQQRRRLGTSSIDESKLRE